jgi:hypothetical protein
MLFNTFIVPPVIIWCTIISVASNTSTVSLYCCCKESNCHPFLPLDSIISSFLRVHVVCEPGSSVSTVSRYGLDYQAIEVRSPAEAKGFFPVASVSRPALGFCHAIAIIFAEEVSAVLTEFSKSRNKRHDFTSPANCHTTPVPDLANQKKVLST